MSVGTPALAELLHDLSALQSLCVVLEPHVKRSRERWAAPGFMSSTFRQLLGAITANPKLSAVTLRHCFTTTTAGETAVPPPEHFWTEHLRLWQFTALTSLSLQGCHVQPQWVGVFSGAFHMLRRLVNVDVSDTVYGGAAVVSTCLAGDLPAMRHLDMAGTACAWLLPASTHAGFDRLFCGLHSLSLDRACSGLGLDLVKPLACVIGQMKQLQSLDLRDNSLADSGMVHVGARLHGLTALTRLDVGYNDCTHIGAYAVLEAATRLREHGCGLRYLGLTKTEISDAEIQRFAKQAKVLKLEVLCIC